MAIGEPQENEAGIQVARTRFFSAKPNETGLTKIKKRFFFSLTHHPKKSIKVKNVAKTVDFRLSEVIEPRKSSVLFLLERFSDIKQVKKTIPDFIFSFFCPLGT